MTEPLAMDRTPALAISVALSVSLLSSCTTAKPAAESSAVEPVPVAAASDGGWILVSDNPITFLPKGMPKDAATEFRDGEWVHSKERDARWFVPKGGTRYRKRSELSAEALAMRTEAEQNIVALRKSGEFAKKSLWTGLILSWGIVRTFGGGDQRVVENALDTIWFEGVDD